MSRKGEPFTAEERLILAVLVLLVTFCAGLIAYAIVGVAGDL